MSFEKQLIVHCAPTLASLKTASLFCCTCFAKIELECQLESWNRQLGQKGLFLTALRQANGRALIYVCRISHLQADLQKPGVANFLSGFGYQSNDVKCALDQLKERLKDCKAFPHEIGIFLGFPLEDVIGFIQNDGKNSLCSGCWKVYCNQYETMKLFMRFQKCREIYTRLWKEGRTVWQLTVAA